MAKQSKGTAAPDSGNVDTVEQPKPGAVMRPEEIGDALAFDEPDPDRDPYAFDFLKFAADGESFTGSYDRLYAKGELKGNEYSCIGFRSYPEGVPTLLPGNVQLWEYFQQHGEPGRVYRVTRMQAVHKEGEERPSFVRFSIQPANVKRVGRMQYERV
jgi:hypothetical protein